MRSRDGGLGRRLWPLIPETVLGRAVPDRFRGARARFGDPDRVLADFVRWLEESQPAPAPAPVHEAPRVRRQPEDSSSRAAVADREKLVSACIDVTDRLTNAALRDILISALADAGVEAIDGDGDSFDAGRHRAIHRVDTDDPRQHGRIASTERLGYSDRGKVIRPPEVSVFSADPGLGE